MDNSRLKNSIRNVKFGLIKYVISFIFPFVIRTVMIRGLGKEYTGLGALFASILQVLNLSELGFSNAVIFSLYKPIADGDKKKISALMCLYKRIYRTVGFVILGAGMLICPFIQYLISGSYPDDINIYVLFLLYLLNTSLSYFVYGYKSALIIAYQRSDIESKIQIISNLICYFLELFAILFLKNYYLFVIAMIIGTLVNNILLYYITRKTYPDISDIGTVKDKERVEIRKNVGALFGHQLDAIIINSADNIVISAFLGLSLLTIYNNYYYIMNAVLSLMIMISNAFTASIGNSIVTQSKDENYKKFKMFSYVIGNLNLLCTVMMFALFQDFMNLWMGKDMTLRISTVLLICIMFYVRQMRRVVLVFKDAGGNWYGDRVKPYISACINLLLNIVLVRLIGLDGVVISTIICMIFIEFPWEGMIVFKKYFNKPLMPYYIEQFKFLGKTVLVEIVVCMFLRDIPCENWLHFFIKLCISFVASFGIIILWGQKEREGQAVFEAFKLLYQK